MMDIHFFFSFCQERVEPESKGEKLEAPAIVVSSGAVLVLILVIVIRLHQKHKWQSRPATCESAGRNDIIPSLQTQFSTCHRSIAVAVI